MSMNTLLRAGVLATCFVPIAASAADWLQWGYDPSHSANNPDETTVSADNVAQLTRRYQITMSANANVAPVLASGIVTPTGSKDLLFVTAQNGRLTAFDAADGSVVWSANTAGTSPTESAPAIDPNRQFVYSYGIDGKAHKYQIGDGTEITDGGWPQIATLKPSVEKGASAISFATSGGSTYLYVVNDGYVGDGGDYQGHLTAIDLSSGGQKVFNSLCSNITIHMMLNGNAGTTDCSERQNGIWGRPGATYDAATDRIYVTTGNGLFDANTGGFNWGDSVLALHPDGSGAGGGLPVDSYTPTNYSQLDGQDVDLGSASLSILPVPASSAIQHLGLQTGKDSKLRLIDLDDMSGTGAPGGVGGEIQLIDVPVSEFWMKTQPAIWVDSSGDGATWVFMANGSGLSGLKLVFDASNRPSLLSTWTKTSDATSAIIANNVVYHAGSCSGGTCLIARAPLSGEVLWTSPTIGNLKWQSPILVNGALYIAAGTKLQRFDLGDVGITHVVTPEAGAHGSIAPSTPQIVADGATTSFAITPDPHYAIDAVTGCGGTLEGGSYTTAAITADCTVSASFVAITHIVTPVVTAGGSVDPATPQTVIDGATTSFAITPGNAGITFTASGCDGTLSGSVYTTAPVTADCTVSVFFSGDDWIFLDGFDPSAH